MKPKTFWILFFLMCITASLTYYVFQGQQTNTQAFRMGDPLFENFHTDPIEEIQIINSQNGGFKTIKIVKKDSGWVVENLFDYPAEFKKILELVEKIKMSKIGRQFEASPEILSRLSLYDPSEQDIEDDQKAIRIKIFSGDQSVLADILIGKQRESSGINGGHYVRFANQNTICLVDQTFHLLGTQPESWIQKELVNIAPEEIETVTCMNPKDQSVIYQIKRPDKNALPELQNAESIETLKIHRIESVFEILSSFQILNVAGKSSEIPDEITGFNSSPVLEFQLFDGTIYRLITGNKAEGTHDGFYLKMETSQNSLWAYIISEWVHQSIITDFDMFFEKPADEP